jgi:phenylacetate-CoA ligase
MTDLYTAIVSGFLFPVHERLKRHSTVRVRKEMERTQWLSAEELSDFQARRLDAFLADVYRHVPYFRRLMDEVELRPNGMFGLEDLARLPLLSKADIRVHGAQLRADDARALSRFNTGGSTGEPLVFLISKERVSHDVAAKWRATRWWGVDIGDREIVVWGSPIEVGAQDRMRSLRDQLFRTHLLPAFEMSSDNLSRFVEAIQRFRPRMLFGYPSALALIARHAERVGAELSSLDIRVVFVTSERLYDDQRAIIERVFHCPVANGYGGRDAGFIAHACPAGRLHITAEDIIVEIVDSQGKRLSTGETGEIVITHLATRDFPFIRYRTGDIGTLSDEGCPCGRSLPVLKNVEGRATDFVIASDGTVMHGLALIYVLRGLPEIERFKIVQETSQLTRVFIQSDSDLSTDRKRFIQTEFRNRLGMDVRVVIEQVQTLPQDRSGKFRYVVSHVIDRQAQGAASARK